MESFPYKTHSFWSALLSPKSENWPGNRAVEICLENQSEVYSSPVFCALHCMLCPITLIGSLICLEYLHHHLLSEAQIYSWKYWIFRLWSGLVLREPACQGGSVNSKVFCRVREKSQLDAAKTGLLCYSVDKNFQGFTGPMHIPLYASAGKVGEKHFVSHHLLQRSVVF